MKNIRVLIVEDDRVSAGLLKNIIDEQPGYSCSAIVDNGVDAINQIYMGRLNLILMDIGLLGPMSGRDAARLILDNFKIPSIFVSAQPDEVTTDSALDTYSYGYVMKPFNRECLFATIELGLRRFMERDS